MKKLVIAAAVLALSAGVNAQDGAKAGATGGVGSIAATTWTALGVTAAIAASIVNNNQSVNLAPGQEFTLACQDPNATLANGICTSTTNTITVTGTGANTTTTTVPVITTAPAIVVPVG